MPENSLQDDELLFGPDSEEESTETETREKVWKVLVVDDEPDVITITKIVLSRFEFAGGKIKLFPANSAKEAKEILSQEDDLAVAYIDVVMEDDHAGLDLVKYIREELKNDDLQVILRTGQPGFAPETQVIVDYAINDYRTKTELTSTKLITTLVSALRNYENIVVARENAKQKATSEATNEAKSLFFAQMSHDFRTPLNGILGVCDLLADSDLNDEQKEYLDVVRGSSEHMLALVNDILDLSKGEAGKIELEEIEFDLTELARSVTKILKTQVKEGVEFKLTLNPSLPHQVVGDPSRIKQILLNLLSNACKFTEKGEIHLSLTHTPSDEDHTRIIMTIEDTGTGIPKDKLAHLFSAYSQADRSVNRQYGGTGLGLSICKQLSNLMDGDIEVTSELGKGSSFEVNILLKKAGPVTEHNEDNDSGRQEEHRNRTYRFLVVDDNATNLLVVKRMLEKLGHQADCVEDGQKALNTIPKYTYDMVLMDCQMPNLDGYDTTRQIRQTKKGPTIPVIALTGEASPEQTKQCFECGMNDFLSKPVRLEELKSIITKWLGLASYLK